MATGQQALCFRGGGKEKKNLSIVRLEMRKREKEGRKMKKGKIVLVVLVFLTLAMLGIVSVVQAEVPRRGNLAIGTHYSFPAFGMSVKYWLTNKWCGQLTFVPFMGSTEGTSSGGMSAYAGKVSYKLTKGRNLYFYGALSAGKLSMRSSASSSSGQHEYEAHLSGTFLSIGFEWWPTKRFALSLEVGYGWFNGNALMNKDPVDLGGYETINTPMVGVGVHSYFL